METITAKQVDGAIDNSTDQIIGGEKSFTAPVNFFPVEPGQFECMRLEGLYLYWLKDSRKLDSEGDLRLGPSLTIEGLSLQKCTSGIWQEYSPGQII